jgi:hypothetical protein
VESACTEFLSAQPSCANPNIAPSACLTNFQFFDVPENLPNQDVNLVLASFNTSTCAHLPLRVVSGSTVCFHGTPAQSITTNNTPYESVLVQATVPARNQDLNVPGCAFFEVTDSLGNVLVRHSWAFTQLGKANKFIPCETSVDESARYVSCLGGTPVDNCISGTQQLCCPRKTDGWNALSSNKNTGSDGFIYYSNGHNVIGLAGAKSRVTPPAGANVVYAGALNSMTPGFRLDPIMQKHVKFTGVYDYAAINLNALVVIQNLPPDTYDVYLYGHGFESFENSRFTVQTMPMNSLGQFPAFRQTAEGVSWKSKFVENVQYVKFPNVEVIASSVIPGSGTVQWATDLFVYIYPPTGNSQAIDYGVLNGIQLVRKHGDVDHTLINVDVVLPSMAASSKDGLAGFGLNGYPVAVIDSATNDYRCAQVYVPSQNHIRDSVVAFNPVPVKFRTAYLLE